MTRLKRWMLWVWTRGEEEGRRLLRWARETVCWLDMIGGSHQWDIHWMTGSTTIYIECRKCGAKRRPR